MSSFTAGMSSRYSPKKTRSRAAVSPSTTCPILLRPQLMARTDENTNRLSEQHAMGFSDGYAALLAIDGVEIWDWTDILNPKQVSRLELPGIFPGYGHGAWWLFWQAPILYVSGAANGIYIVDVSDPEHPLLVDRGELPNPIPNSQTGGFRVGPIFAVGNILVISSNDGRGYATLDISDPINPALLDSLGAGSPASYSSMVNGNHIYAAGTDDDLHGLDISNPRQIQRLDSVPMNGKGGYLTIQDSFAHVGASRTYVKVDISDDSEYAVVGSATSSIEGHDEDFAVVLGNLVVLSDDKYNGSFIFPHQTEPDNAGPLVNMVVPADGVIGQSRTSRVGLTFTDQIDLRSVNASTFIVRPLDGEPVIGQYSGQTGIVNFSPDRPLASNTVYEVIIPSGGITDVTGNPTTQEFRTTFSTGENAGGSLLCDVKPVDVAAVGHPIEFKAEILAGSGDITYLWDFGDDSPTVGPDSLSRVSHAYRDPGHYTVRVTVSDGRYSTNCASLATRTPPCARRTCPLCQHHHPRPLRNASLERQPRQQHRLGHQCGFTQQDVRAARWSPPAHTGPGARRHDLGRQSG